MLIVKRFQEALRELAVIAGRHVKRVGLGLDAPISLGHDRIGAKAQAEGIIRLAVRDRLVARDAQDRLQEQPGIDTAFPQVRRGVVAREAAQQVLVEVVAVGPLGIDFVPCQPVAPENDQEHGRQILVEVADRLLDNLTAGLVLFTTGQILKRVDEYDAATPLSGASGAARRGLRQAVW